MKHIHAYSLSIAFLGIVAVMLRYDPLFATMYSPDELMHLFIAHAPSAHGVWERGLLETHPPLGHMLRHVSMMLQQNTGLGDSFLWERMISACFGLATLVLWYHIGRMVAGRRGGCALLLIGAVSPHMIGASAEIRNYALFMLLHGAAMLCYLRYDAGRAKRNLLGYSIYAALACMTHFTGFLLVAICGLDAAWKSRAQLKTLAPMALATVPAALLAALSYHYFFADGTAASGWREHYMSIGKHYAPSAKEAIQNILLLFDITGMGSRLAQQIQYAFPIDLMVGAVGLSAYGYGLHCMRQTASHYLSLTVCALIVAILAAVTELYPLSASRHSLYALPFLCLPIIVWIASVPLATTRSYGVMLLCLLTLGFASLACDRNARQHDRLAFTPHDYYALAQVWKRIPPEGPPIIVNRLTSLYLIFAHNRGRTPYDVGDGPFFKHVMGRNLATDATRYHWTFDAARLRGLIAQLEAEDATSPAWRFMFINRYGWDLEPFYLCLKSHGDATGTKTRSLTFFTVNREAASLSHCIDRVDERGL